MVGEVGVEPTILLYRSSALPLGDTPMDTRIGIEPMYREFAIRWLAACRTGNGGDSGNRTQGTFRLLFSKEFPSH